MLADILVGSVESLFGFIDFFFSFLVVVFFLAFVF